MDFQSPAQILFPKSSGGLVVGEPVEMPPRSLIGLKEKLEVIGEIETDRNIHGQLVTYRPAWTRPYGTEIYRITLSASGDDIHKGVLDDLPVGTRLTYRSSDWWVATIQYGVSATTLKRKAVAGSVHVRNPRLMKSPDLPHTVEAVSGFSDWRVRLPATLPYPVNVFYRPEMLVEVVGRDRGDTDRHGRNRSWGLTLEEIGPVTAPSY